MYVAKKFPKHASLSGWGACCHRARPGRPSTEPSRPTSPSMTPGRAQKHNLSMSAKRRSSALRDRQQAFSACCRQRTKQRAAGSSTWSRS